ncbi:DNA replication/repair protein RecF [bacterium]|nr:DNA replication/repair protein RecF [bacterium]
MMKVAKIALQNYRNYSSQSLSFAKGLNIVEGMNASGKTNLIEAVYFCSIGRSPRTSKDKELIKWGEKEARISIVVEKKYRAHKIDVSIADNGQKRIVIDGSHIARMGELMGVLNVVFFSPDDLKMIKESPQERRTFMDISLCQQNKVYFYNLLKYNQILAQRNKLLKTARTLSELSETIPVWNVQLAEQGAKLVMCRLDFLNTINPLADKIHRAIAGKDEGLALFYERSYQGDSQVDVKECLLAKLSDNIEKEYSLGYTLTGLHRDDFSILSNGIELRSFGSQGQQRTAALAVKLAEISYFEQKTGELPVLLLDDVFSELDIHRRSALLAATENVQTIITCTEFKENVDNYDKKIIVSNGTIVS